MLAVVVAVAKAVHALGPAVLRPQVLEVLAAELTEVVVTRRAVMVQQTLAVAAVALVMAAMQTNPEALEVLEL
jgi:hypothetical protein